jgi:hypothetical protein
LRTFTDETYEPPKMDIDVNIVSPKVIINEGLLNLEVPDKEEMICIVVDLGTVKTHSSLVQKEEALDYNKCTDPSKMYDEVTAKFEKLKIYVDYGV